MYSPRLYAIKITKLIIDVQLVHTLTRQPAGKVLYCTLGTSVQHSSESPVPQTSRKDKTGANTKMTVCACTFDQILFAASVQSVHVQGLHTLTVVQVVCTE